MPSTTPSKIVVPHPLMGEPVELAHVLAIRTLREAGLLADDMGLIETSKLFAEVEQRLVTRYQDQYYDPELLAEHRKRMADLPPDPELEAKLASLAITALRQMERQKLSALRGIDLDKAQHSLN